MVVVVAEEEEEGEAAEAVDEKTEMGRYGRVFTKM